MHLPAGLIFSVVTPAFIIGPLPHITEAIFSEANIKVANSAAFRTVGAPVHIQMWGPFAWGGGGSSEDFV